jgi:putative transposase
MAIEKELLDQLLAGRDPKELFSKNGLLDDLKKALSERILSAELDEHLDGERMESSINRRHADHHHAAGAIILDAGHVHADGAIGA